MSYLLVRYRRYRIGADVRYVCTFGIEVKENIWYGCCRFVLVDGREEEEETVKEKEKEKEKTMAV